MVRLLMYNTREEEKSWALEWAKQNNVEVEMTADLLTMDTVEQAKGFDGISLSQVAPIDEVVYSELASYGIKQIAQRSAGVDMYNLELAQANHLIISNVPSYSPESIAEFTVSAALNLIRKVELIQARVERQDFRWTPEIRGRVLGDMTVAIIGTGRIGSIAAKFFKGFGAKVIGYDLYPNALCEDVLHYVDSIETAIVDADIVSIHMPATADNYYLFDYDLFRKFKKGAMLLNMARGSIVKTQDLLRALDEELLAGAALDTYESEAAYIPKDWSDKPIEDDTFQKVLNHPKISYTPHIAYYTDEAVKNLVEGGLNAALEVIQTGTTKNRMN
ncbi:D-2-hydroxyacid dehydrogenase [Aerococcaceae bacterium zg-B36]|uniref:D-2-hydroxyacid dehydrogenase n=1 Tax=Aerococcaceae bacterium zg-252 TaxID=2796928 RepID=UPI001BD8BC2A|nr:D-2-hydroxyacid dehydrogenase [Aerococcaceae bacterium zg-B36]